MRWLALLALTGCVPISADEYAGGPRGALDSSTSSADTREDARAPSLDAALREASVDASAVEAAVAPPKWDAATPLHDDADGGLDAAAPDASRPDSSVGDAGKDTGALEMISCATEGVLCDEFESGPMCPSMPAPTWSECEHIHDATGPVLEKLAGDGGYALRSRVSADAVERSQRVLRLVPVDADYFEAEFWMITDPSDNEWFVWTKFQQEVGHDSDGDPLNYPGVSLLGSSGNLAVAVETQQSLSPATDTFYKEAEIGAWPAGWHHYKLQIDFKTPSVHVEYYDESGTTVPWDLPTFPLNKVPVNRQYLALGLYAENPGAVQMLFDGVQAYAMKNGKVIPLL
jgi:hypothetical protein